MENGNIQVLFFQHLKHQLPSHVSVVEEIADVLGISTDSAYRRLRGEKPLSFDELQVLCRKFKISLDQLFHLESNSIIFTGKTAGQEGFSFRDYIQDIVHTLSYINKFEKREISFYNRDIPFFFHFYYPKLAAFKSFFYLRCILNDPQFIHQKFVFDCIDEGLLESGRQVSEAYSQLPSTEVWNAESIDSTLGQIDYCRASGFFKNREDVNTVYDELQKCMDVIELQTEYGYKMNGDGTVHYRHIPYKIYINEFILADTTILAKLNNDHASFLVHSVFNYIYTRDRSFNELTNRHFQNILKRSTLISESGEKDRRRFFNHIRDRINAGKNANL